jgi:hypothetical protein
MLRGGDPSSARKRQERKERRYPAPASVSNASAGVIQRCLSLMNTSTSNMMQAADTIQISAVASVKFIGNVIVEAD